MTPRGIRMCNPGNLREPKGGGIQWDGERATDEDPSFEEFISPEYGIRALYRVLTVYQSHYGLVTVQDMLNRFAPPSENDTGAYISHVAAAMHIKPDVAFDIREKHHALEMISAIILHENGVQPYSQATIIDGINLA